MRKVYGVIAALVLTSAGAASTGCTISSTRAQPDPAPAADGGSPSTDKGSADAAAEVTPAQFCASYCARAHICDGSVDVDTCAHACENSAGAKVAKLRTDAVAALSSCLDGKDCKSFGQGDVVNACFDETSASLAPSAKATSFCDDYLGAEGKCGKTADRATCLVAAKMYSDPTLADAGKCLAKACGQIDDCIDAALDVTPSAAACTSKLSYSTASCGQCVGASCCAEDNACANDATCMPFLNCYSRCTTQSCVDSCAAQYPSGARAASALSTCMTNACPSACK